MIVKLKSGAFSGEVSDTGDMKTLDRRALLVYAGSFESMTGPVTVTPAHIAKLAASHNALLTRLGGALSLRLCPPVQLDHSTSARDTVGRLVGGVEVGEHIDDDGATVQALFGTVRILGRDNVEKVVDERWTNLSLGFDMDTGDISEVTITPFPAARQASMLSRGDGNQDDQKESDDMHDKKKLKAYLTGRKGLSESDADAQLAAADDAALTALSKECDDDETKLSADKEKEEGEAKLAAAAANTARLSARAQLAPLGVGFKSMADQTRLAAKKGRILTRLSKLRAEAKITPAEIRKMDIAQLSASDEASIELVMKSYNDREPVIMIGQIGTTRATSLSRVSTDKKAALEAEVKANMGLGPKTGKKLTKLQVGVAEDLAAASVLSTDGMTDTEFVNREFAEICALLDGGDIEGAKARLKTFLAKMGSMGGSDYAEVNAIATDAELSAMTENLTKLQAQFDTLHKLASDFI